MIPILLLNLCNPNFLISKSEINKFDSWSFSISDILKITYKIEDFPAPVLPTQPIFSPL